MHRKLGFLLVVVAATSLLFTATAVADPTGDNYFVTFQNIGLGPGVDWFAPVTFGGGAENLPIPGGGGALSSTWVDESAFSYTAADAAIGAARTVQVEVAPGVFQPVPYGSLPAANQTGFESAGGEALEIWFTNFDPNVPDPSPNPGDRGPAFIGTTDNTLPLGFGVHDIDWVTGPNAGLPAKAKALSAFFYFTIDGVPVDIFAGGPIADPAGPLVVGQHPWAAVPHEVFLLGGDAPNGVVFPNGSPFLPATLPSDGLDLGLSTLLLSPPVGFSTLVNALYPNAPGLDGFINDIHFGVIVEHIPEPSTYVLMAMGAMAMIPVIRRRKRS